MCICECPKIIILNNHACECKNEWNSALNIFISSKSDENTINVFNEFYIVYLTLCEEKFCQCSCLQEYDFENKYQVDEEEEMDYFFGR